MAMTPLNPAGDPQARGRPKHQEGYAGGQGGGEARGGSHHDSFQVLCVGRDSMAEQLVHQLQPSFQVPGGVFPGDLAPVRAL